MVMTPYVIAFLKFYFIFTVIVMILFAIRHFIFTFNRMYCEQMLFLAVYLVLIIPLLKKIGGRHSIMVIWSF